MYYKARNIIVCKCPEIRTGFDRAGRKQPGDCRKSVIKWKDRS